MGTLFTFEEYIKSHKILILNNASQLSKYPNIDCDGCYIPLKTWWAKRLYRIYEHVPAQYLDRSRWYSGWKKCVEEYDVIVIINQIRGRDVIEYIRERNPNARIVIYYETTIDPSDRKAPHHYQGLGVEFYSFDPKDCEIWGLRFAPYFYSFYQGTMEELYELYTGSALANPSDLDIDVFFVGYDKGRWKKLVALQQEMENRKIHCKMFIVQTPHHHYPSSSRRHLTKKTLPYDKIVEYISHSRCILDFVEEGQTGITLRPMEAVCFHKKLITNNPNVRKYDFYRPENVFILGERDVSELRAFLDQPYVPLSWEIAQNYTAEAWLDRILKDQ